MRSIPFFTACSALLLASCVTSALAPTETRVYHYVRSNIDGSEAEKVVVYPPTRASVAVFKGRDRCTDAAYVTAKLGPDGVARELVGGRLTRALDQRPEAWMVREPGALTVHPGARNAPVATRIGVPSGAWHLYDFDFADLIAAPPPALRQGRDYRFQLPLLLVTQDGSKFSNLGEARFVFERAETHVGIAARRYRATGPAFGDRGGDMWFDANSGRLLDARIALPNHSEYRNFRLRLVRTEYGADAWRATLADHWQGCRATAE